MQGDFQRLFMMSEPEALSLNAQAALGPVRVPHRSQFSLLVRHFLERFFNHETASPDGDAKGRLILIALATSVPGFMVALYLYPVYHPFLLGSPGRSSIPARPPYWTQVNHHFFFVIYSFVAMGIFTVFEWDLFFPDLLDVFVLSTLPIHDRRLFRARVAAIALFIAGFLFDANCLAPLVLPAAIDPPNLPPLLAGHIIAVLASGLFSAAFILALQGVLLAVLGEHLFRRISLILQGVCITVLLMILFLFPALSGAIPVLLRSGSPFVFYCPPFWFLGIYQRILEGSAALPIYSRLAEIGCAALLIALALAALAYPTAYTRRVRQLVIGPSAQSTRNWAVLPFKGLLHATLIRHPVGRAVFHFIGATLLRVQRYRIYLVLYGGVGLSVVVASILRLSVAHGRVGIDVSADGIRSAIAIVAFWTIAGFRTAFVSPGNRQGSWPFRSIHGQPPQLNIAMQQLRAAKLWVEIWAAIVTFSFCLVFHFVAPAELRNLPATASLLLIAAAMCLLLTDLFFLNVKTVAFSGEQERRENSLAMTLLKFFTFFPFVVGIPLVAQPWIEGGILHFLTAVAVIIGLHLGLSEIHKRIIREHCNMPALEDDEEDFPMKLGLRY